MEILLKVIFSYLVGSLSGSLILGKIKGIDIRNEGSGNAGSTNALRTQGKLFALIVLMIDVTKGIIAVKFIANIYSLPPNSLLLLCGGAVIIGHIYPIFFGFKGGKGAGTAIGVIGSLNYIILLIAIPIWIIILIFTGFVGLGTMISSISIPLFSYFFGEDIQFIIFSSILALLMIFTHRSNLQRMVKGKENRFEKAMIFRKNN
ncbi:MAG: glycerol-3-phosphate 1-O-acyltransferase PlsY [Candidatus Marinimicrobia bacterium]|nr:glycerol-3-phosphate 1-O-acyltransferase PlsY [Candidatus Neomarinimicrobiota bacterium]MBL7022835.1 glycerol-3-phosphate 1-O-acyltransferase PlsY [Candidatus Neomarinimicrobiota bacterium]MBL7109444.1 glycerol-3-phosphate 1-O-acyltransferase PlsY [Candidatus Neomarinimicrobiota bacterium]